MHLFDVPLNYCFDIFVTPRGMGDSSGALPVSTVELVFTPSHTLSSHPFVLRTPRYASSRFLVDLKFHAKYDYVFSLFHRAHHASRFPNLGSMITTLCYLLRRL